MTLLDFLTDDLMLAVGGVLGTALLYGLSRIKSATVRYLANLAVDKGIPIAFNYVEELARKSPNKLDDKAVLALKALRDYLSTYGVTPTPEQESRARLVFNALHAQSKPAPTDYTSAVARAQFGFLSNNPAFHLNAAKISEEANRGSANGLERFDVESGALRARGGNR